MDQISFLVQKYKTKRISAFLYDSSSCGQTAEKFVSITVWLGYTAVFESGGGGTPQIVIYSSWGGGEGLKKKEKGKIL